MTNWEKVRGSIKPLDIDTISSPSTVYLHKNIEEIEVTDENSEETHTEWQYDEIRMSKEEWSQLQSIYPILHDSIEDTINLQDRTSQIEDAVVELSEAIYE